MALVLRFLRHCWQRFPAENFTIIRRTIYILMLATIPAHHNASFSLISIECSDRQDAVAIQVFKVSANQPDVTTLIRQPFPTPIPHPRER